MLALRKMEEEFVNNDDDAFKYPEHNPRERSKNLVVVPSGRGMNWLHFLVMCQKKKTKYTVSIFVNSIDKIPKELSYPFRVRYYPHTKYHLFRVTHPATRSRTEVMISYSGDPDNIHFMTQGVVTGIPDSYLLAVIRYLIKSENYSKSVCAAFKYFIRYSERLGI